MPEKFFLVQIYVISVISVKYASVNGIIRRNVRILWDSSFYQFCFTTTHILMSSFCLYASLTHNLSYQTTLSFPPSPIVPFFKTFVFFFKWKQLLQFLISALSFPPVCSPQFHQHQDTTLSRHICLLLCAKTCLCPQTTSSQSCTFIEYLISY